MTYSLEIRAHLYKIFEKMAKKDRLKLAIIDKKTKEILENPYRFKPLKHPMQNKRRVHISGSFVLVFSIDEKSKTIILEDFDHHDNVYK